MRQTPAAILLRLNLETRDSHAEADSAWLSLLTPDLRLHEYAAMLIKTYGFEAALEAALAYTPGLDERLDVRSRARSGYLAEDLLALCFPPADIARLAHAEILPFASDASALGWIYVADRATLIHAVIRRQVIARRPELSHATAYLATSADGAAARWRELGRALDAAGRTHDGAAQIIAGAHHAFQFHRRWFFGGLAARAAERRRESP